MRLVIVGYGPAGPALHKALPQATFLGVRKGLELAGIYASFDIFAHTGPCETFGQAVQEAMVSGLPVVAPRAGGPMDLVQDGRTGYLVPPFEAAGFTDVGSWPRTRRLLRNGPLDSPDDPHGIVSAPNSRPRDDVLPPPFPPRGEWRLMRACRKCHHCQTFRVLEGIDAIHGPGSGAHSRPQ